MNNFYTLFFKSLLLLCCSFPPPGFAQHLQRLNPGTKSDIRYFTMFSDSGGFLVSDKIRHLEKVSWKPLQRNGNAKPSLFYASGHSDYWYSINTESSTSEIFHVEKNTLVKVSSPFANEVTAVCSTTPDTVLFASFSEVALRTKDGFEMLEPLPGSFNMTKLQMISSCEFWALTREGRLFHYSGSGYKLLLPNETVRDFFFGNTSTVILCDKAIYRLNHGNPKLFLSDQRLQLLSKIAVTRSGIIWLAGTGTIHHITAGRLQIQAKYPGKAFRGIFIDGSDDAWFYGDHGLLMYSGKRGSEPYDSLKPGFTGHKILEFGIKADDEYGVAFADLNGDGREEIYTVRIYNPNRLYMNTGQGTFTDCTGDYFPDSVMLTNGAVFADMNLDGYPDLFLANVGGNVFFENQHGKYFKDATRDYGLDAAGYSTGCAVSDIDNDGDHDLYVCNYINENSMLYINRMDGKRSVTFKLRGIRSNRDAIGAKIWLYTTSRISGGDSLAGYREITCGEGYGSVNSKKVLFAISTFYEYRAVVKFPSTADTLYISTIRPGGTIAIDEINGPRRSMIQAKKLFSRLTKDREILMEIAKYLLVIILLVSYIWSNRKGYRKIFTIRWSSITVLFALFVIVNQLLVFHQSRILFYVAPATAIIGLFLIHLITERFILKRMTENEKVHLREKIARDLHDDLASTLGTISIYADSLHTAKAPSAEYIGKLSEKISDLTHVAKQSITDIIWMTSPRNDSLQGLVVKIGSMMAEAFHEAGKKFSQEIQIQEDQLFLKEEMRNNLFLILKEAMNNILKHSRATEVIFTVKRIDHRTCITLTDNGAGFDIRQSEDKPVQGNGIIMLTVLEDAAHIVRAITAGADGYILKKTHPHKIPEAIQQVLEGGAVLTPIVARQIFTLFKPESARPDAENDLTIREKEILTLLIEGQINEKIAEKLFISPQTVRSHVKNIYAKLQVHNRAEVVAKALKDQLLRK